jgi:hypothetical protein
MLVRTNKKRLLRHGRKEIISIHLRPKNKNKLKIIKKMNVKKPSCLHLRPRLFSVSFPKPGSDYVELLIELVLVPLK